MKSTKKTLFLIKYADHVITSSPFLNSYCLSLNKKSKSTYITSSINTDYIKPKNYTNFNNNLVTIGWTGTFTSKIYLDTLINVFQRLAKKYEFKLIIIGNFNYFINDVSFEVIEWTLQNELLDLHRIDIGVYPLIKEDWVLGKSGLKVIQYLALGIPSVSTNYGSASNIIIDKKNGFLANTEDEWYNILEELINNKLLRQQIGLQARQTAENNYSTKVVKNKYLEILNNT